MSSDEADLESLLGADAAEAFEAGRRLFGRIGAALEAGGEVDLDTLTALGLRRAATTQDQLDRALLEWSAAQPEATVTVLIAFVFGLWRRAEPQPGAVEAALALATREDLGADATYALGSLLVDGGAPAEAVRALAAREPLPQASRQALLRRLG